MKLLLLSLLILSSTIYGMGAKNPYANNKVIQEVKRYSKTLKKEGIELSSYGLNYADAPGEDGQYKIREVSVGYEMPRLMRPMEARTQFYEVIDGLINYLNGIEDIRDMFQSYPIGYADVEIHCGFDQNGGDVLKNGDVCSIHILNHKICYIFLDKEDGQKPTLKKLETGLWVSYDMFANMRSVIHSLPETPEDIAEFSSLKIE